MDTTRMEGLGVALVTPFDRDHQVDLNGLGKLLSHIGENADYFVVCGSTGESVTLDKDEKSRILEFVVANVPEDKSVVYGLGGNNTRALLRELETSAIHGASAILSVSPAYNKPSDSGLIKHYTELADASPLPVILYNVPGRTGCNMRSRVILELAKHENIIGVKEASGDLAQATNIAAGKPDDFLLISGDDMLTLPMMSIGAVGLISVLGNAYPEQFREMIRHFRMGEYEKAMKRIYPFTPLNPLLYEEGNPSGIKEVLMAMGICENHVRLPLDRVSNDLSARIRNAMP